MKKVEFGNFRKKAHDSQTIFTSVQTRALFYRISSLSVQTRMELAFDIPNVDPVVLKREKLEEFKKKHNLVEV